MRTLPGRFLLLLVLLGAVVLAVWWQQRAADTEQSKSGGSEGGVRLVAVFPLVAEDDASREVAAGIGRLLGHRLSGNGPWRRIPSQCLRRPGAAADAWTPEAARERARELGATAFVLGKARVAEGRLEAEVRWYPIAGASPEATARVHDSLQKLASVVDRLAEQLEAGRVEPERIRIARVAAVTSDSLPALLAYFRAEDRLERGELSAAETELDRAIEEDPQFALAYYRLAEVAARQGHRERAVQSRQNALLLSNRLPVQERALADLLVLRLRRQTAEAEQGYRGIVRDQPSEWEAWCALAELAEERGDHQRAREALQQAAGLLPSQADPCGTTVGRGAS
ncbi:MAG: hypothetical protein KatS3mg077_3230 [Candidatus Binatia bacterium]|nr:MAG: hypothetical protein KatS3mg077_3230 [Candidatus Binatia bacterium]